MSYDIKGKRWLLYFSQPDSMSARHLDATCPQEKPKLTSNPYAPPAESPETVCTSRYLAVSKRKLAIMVLGTHGLYIIYWFYRQWKAYAQSSGGSQWAWARGFFWWIFSYNLFGKLQRELVTRGESINWSHKGRGLILIATGICYAVAYQIHPIYAVVSSVVTLLVTTYVLMGTVPAINRLADDPDGASNCRLTWANWLWLLAGALEWAFLVLVTFVLMNPELFVH